MIIDLYLFVYLRVINCALLSKQYQCFCANFFPFKYNRDFNADLCNTVSVIDFLNNNNNNKELRELNVCVNVCV